MEILSVDRLAYRLVERERGTKPTVVQEKELRHMWSAAGHGTRLGREQLRRARQAAQTVTRQLRERSLWTYLQLASEAAFLVRQSLETLPACDRGRGAGPASSTLAAAECRDRGGIR